MRPCFDASWTKWPWIPCSVSSGSKHSPALAAILRSSAKLRQVPQIEQWYPSQISQRVRRRDGGAVAGAIPSADMSRRACFTVECRFRSNSLPVTGASPRSIIVRLPHESSLEQSGERARAPPCGPWSRHSLVCIREGCTIGVVSACAGLRSGSRWSPGWRTARCGAVVQLRAGTGLIGSISLRRGSGVVISRRGISAHLVRMSFPLLVWRSR